MSTSIKGVRLQGKHDVDDTLIGAEGDDFLYGGIAWSSDKLYGRDGNDVLWGGNGDDYLDGGKGNDELAGSRSSWAWQDTYVFRLGDGFDYIKYLRANPEKQDIPDHWGNDIIEFLWGDEDAGRFQFTERGGDVVIIYGDGGTEDDTVYTYHRYYTNGGDGGGTIRIGNMSLAEFKESGVGFTIRGGDGDNTLHGAFGRDKIYGGKGDDTLKGKRRDDELYGQDGDDTLYGGKGNDIMFGGAGNDYLGGGKNDDILWGGTGDDTLRGGFGSDRFSFRKGAGNDTIWDFGDDDTIQLDGVGHGFDGLTIVNDENGNAVVTYGDDAGGGAITLLDVTAESLSEADFLFT